MKISKRSILFFSTSGVALIEFALLLPIMMVLIFGVVELTRFIQANQKLVQASYALADLLTQGSALDTNDIPGLLQSVEVMIAPFPSQDLTVVVNHIRKPVSLSPQVEYASSYPAGRESMSRISSGVGSQPNVPGFSYVDGDELMVVEIFYTYRSLLGIQITDPFVPGQQDLYKMALTRPRYGSIVTITP